MIFKDVNMRKFIKTPNKKKRNQVNRYFSIVTFYTFPFSSTLMRHVQDLTLMRCFLFFLNNSTFPI